MFLIDDNQAEPQGAQTAHLTACAPPHAARTPQRAGPLARMHLHGIAVHARERSNARGHLAAATHESAPWACTTLCCMAGSCRLHVYHPPPPSMAAAVLCSGRDDIECAEPCIEGYVRRSRGCVVPMPPVGERGAGQCGIHGCQVVHATHAHKRAHVDRFSVHARAAIRTEAPPANHTRRAQACATRRAGVCAPRCALPLADGGCSLLV